MRTPFFLCLLLTLLMRAPAFATYDVSGVALHQCSCPYACPCMFENGPEDCALAAVYHIEKGTYNGVDVSGLSFLSMDGAVSSHGGKRVSISGGSCCATPKKAKAPAGVVYLDSRATTDQKRALLALLQAHGEWPGAGRPLKAVPIVFATEKDGYRVSVPGLFDGRVERVLSRNKMPLTVSGVGFAEGTQWTVGRSLVNDLHDDALGLHWHMPGTNGSWTHLHWTGK